MGLLSVKGLNQQLGKASLLHNITLEADAGKTVALLGPNGAGKTTLLRTLMGLYRLPRMSTAQVWFNSFDIAFWQVDQRIAAGLVYLPQHSSLFDGLSVHDNFLLIFEHHPLWRRKRHWWSLRVDTTELESFYAELYRWLDILDIRKTLKQPVSQLSGGQKRKVELVRALLLRPKLLLLDEPFAGVDPKSIYEIKEIITLLAAQGIGIVISDHHVQELLALASYIYVVYQGRVVASGDVAAIMADTYTQEVYLGRAFHAQMAARFS